MQASATSVLQLLRKTPISRGERMLAYQPVLVNC